MFLRTDDSDSDRFVTENASVLRSACLRVKPGAARESAAAGPDPDYFSRSAIPAEPNRICCAEGSCPGDWLVR